MATHKHKDAPRIVNISVWSAAVIGAMAFSLSLGAHFYNIWTNGEILADTNNQCPSGQEQLAINNYPAGKLIEGTHRHYYINQTDRYFRCSVICISSDTSKTYETRLHDVLDNSTINGKPVTIYKTSDDFNHAISQGDEAKTLAMTNGIIFTSSMKRTCTGIPNSINYGKIVKNDDEVSKLARGDESSQPAIDEQGIVQSDATGARTIAGSGVQGGTGVSAPIREGEVIPENTETTNDDSALAQCKEYINNFLVRWQNKDNIDRLFVKGMSRFYSELKRDHQTGKISTREALSRCETYKNTITSYFNGEYQIANRSQQNTQSENAQNGEFYKANIQLIYKNNGRYVPLKSEAYVLVFLKNNNQTGLIGAGYYQPSNNNNSKGEVELLIRNKSGLKKDGWPESIYNSPNTKITIYAVTTGGIWGRSRISLEYRNLFEEDLDQMKVDINRTALKTKLAEHSISKVIDIYEAATLYRLFQRNINNQNTTINIQEYLDSYIL